ncbi:hypothetical protein F4803DRAFT_571657 [Xylaria telfairii]|nr:hypothetical protein F4803DRAFT_571657 [Xylaria telfairii]
MLYKSQTKPASTDTETNTPTYTRTDEKDHIIFDPPHVIFNMYFISLISIAALALAHGARSEREHIYHKLHLTSNSVCRTTTWVFNAQAKAPLVSDCQKMEKTLRKHGKDGFLLHGWDPADKQDDYLILQTEGTCNFGVSIIDVNNAPAVIANGDIADLLRDSIKYYSNGDHVSGVGGVMPCKANWESFSAQKTAWSIFAT